MTTTKKRLGEILVEQNVITREQLDDALEQQAELGLPVGETLIALEFVTENLLLKTLSRHLNVEYLNIGENYYEVIDKSLAGLLPRDVCERLRVVPIFLLDDDAARHLTLAMSNPLNIDGIVEVEEMTDSNVFAVLTTSSAIAGGIEKLYETPKKKLPGLGAPLAFQDENIQFVNRLLVQAVQMGASDIHVEPQIAEANIRFRIDGVLRLIEAFDLKKLPAAVIRLKIMGSEKTTLMRIDSKMVPQDGSFARVIGGHTVDFRVATFPTIYGEKAAIRILDRDNIQSINRISDLGMPPGVESQLIRCIKQSSGIIIATGPTGSGKSTTLYSAINYINDVSLNIITIEDPVEYRAPEFVNQTSLKREVGFTYSVALRSIIRQDPDVILIGEIRDLETAEIAIQAALTGHLVFTTLHTDDAAGAIVRLVDLGIEQFLVSSTVVSAINQRLLRKVCPHCKEKYTPTMAEMRETGVDEELAREILDNPDKFKFYMGTGCNKCYRTGYLGRQGAFELLHVTPAIKKLILEKETSDVIAEKAREKDNINMLFEDGLRLVLTGVTTFDELRRIPRGDYKLKPLKEIFESVNDASYN
ncbi:MAG: type II/IV secretion system protein [Desulfobacterales bacterium]|nr:type II/IV secretion system protein [Desulfobacterales bacterium]